MLIVSFGFETKFGNAFLRKIEGHGFFQIDCREYLPRDPAAAVGHGQNGEFPQTQMSVFGQKGFLDFIQQLFQRVEEGKCKLAIGCRQGMHRSDTAGRALEDLLNGVVDHVGNRVFNAKHFAVSQCYGNRGLHQLFENTRAWIDDPWTVIEGGPRDRAQRYGYKACMGSPASASTWTALHEWVDHRYPVPGVQVVPRDELEAAEGPPQHRDRPSLIGYPHELPPAPPVPPRFLEPEGELDDDAPAFAGGGATKAEEKDEEASTEGGSRGAKRDRAVLEKWETFEPDPTVWSQFLSSVGVDTIAKQELFLLAQHSGEGHEQANSIIAKLLKKQADSESISNPSGFIHRCVCNARTQMRSWRWEGASSASWGRSSTDKWW